MFKKQRYYHGANAANAARDSEKADVVEDRRGTDDDGNGGWLAGWWITTKNGHINVKNEEMGPAANLHVVAFFSIAGIIGLIVAFFVLPLLGG